MPKTGSGSPVTAVSSGKPTPALNKNERNRRLLPVMTITTLLSLTFVSACGIRLETSIPSELTPDSNEIARQAIVNDFELVLQNSETASAGNPAEVKAELEVITEHAEIRSAAFGGPYESGLPAPDSDLIEQEPSSNTLLTAPGTVESTANKLLESAARARTSLEIPQDSGLARIIASAAIGQVIEALDIERVSGVDVSWPQALTPIPWTTEAPVLSDEVFSALISSQDYAGYAYEVAAAMGAPEKRDSLLKIAKTHRAEAESLAVSAAVAGTSNDPRRTAYSLPLTLDADNHVPSTKELKRMLRDIELSLAQQYLDTLPLVSPVDRALLFDAALESSRAARDRGADLSVPFPLITDSEQINATTFVGTSD